MEYKIFRTRPANITISVNGRFVDCFSLGKNYGATDNVLPEIDSKWYDELNKSHWFDTNNDSNVVEKIWGSVKLPKCIKVYQIDEEHLGGLLNIQVENENSDFTNGFMKHSSLIKIPLIALFPSHMSDNNGEKLLKTMIRLYNTYWANPSKDEQTAKKRNRGSLTKHNWPLVDSFFARRESEIHEKSKKVTVYHNIGGTFTAEIPVEKKHKIFFLRSSYLDTKGFFLPDSWSMAIASYKPLLNIYNEDQRSNRTKD
jgi:hypothetical protein